jgi:hypothetical protein
MRRWVASSILPLVFLLLPSDSLAQSITWVHQFGTSEGFDIPWGVVSVGSDVYVDGLTEGTFPGETSLGGMDGFLQKVDASGAEVWTLQFGTSRDDSIFGLAASATGVYVAGATTGTFPGQAKVGGSDGFLQKYDFDGNELWTVQFGTPEFDSPSGVVVGATGEFVVGSTLGAFPGQTNLGADDAFLTRFDPAGNQDWTVQFGSHRSDIGISTLLGPEGVFVNGFTYGALPGQRHRGGSDAFAGLFSSGGARVWLRQFGTRADDYATGIAADTTGLYVSGSTDGRLKGQVDRGGTDAYVRKFASDDGSTIWTDQFGTSQPEVQPAVAVSGNKVLVEGATYGAFGSFENLGSDDIFVRSFDTLSGSRLWTLQFGTTDRDDAHWAWSDAGVLYVLGLTGGTFDGEVSAGGFSDSFLARIAPA